MLAVPLGSNLIMSYKINIELIKIPESMVLQLESQPFESIWPMILYLFNYWVKNQANLMRLSQTHAQKQVY